MNQRHESRRIFSAFALVIIMALSTTVPMGLIIPAQAHSVPGDVVWPTEGTNDTGWVQLSTTGANSSTNTKASATWNLSFAPGAEVSNVHLEIQVRGEDGIIIDEPHLFVGQQNNANIVDMRGWGTLGQTSIFDGSPASSTASGQLNPNSFSGAQVTLPTNAEITTMIIEALSPADPAVSLREVKVEIIDSEIDPNDHKMYLAVDSNILVLSFNGVSSTILDVLDLNKESILDIEIDSQSQVLQILHEDGTFSGVSLDDNSIQNGLPNAPTNYLFNKFIHDGQTWWASYSGGVASLVQGNWTPAGQQSSGANDGLDMLVLNGLLYVSHANLGVQTIDISNGNVVSQWSTANNLHSDFVTEFLVVGNQLFMASHDSGIGRYDWNSGFWLSTWNSGNWLTSNYIGGLALSGNSIYILNGKNLQTYNSTSGVFVSGGNFGLSSEFGLLGDGQSLTAWPVGGVFGPSYTSVIVGDGSGRLIAYDESTGNHADILLASGPSSGDMSGLVELNGIIYVGAKDLINRYDVSAAEWATPFSNLGNQNQNAIAFLRTDGQSIFACFKNGDVAKVSATGQVQNYYTSSQQTGSRLAGCAVDSTNLVIIASGVMAFIDHTTTNAGWNVFNTQNGLDSSFLTDVAMHNQVIYIASEDEGVLRYNTSSNSFLQPWSSTEVNGVDFAPVALVGDILHLGLPGFGVARKDLALNEIIEPLITAQGNSGNRFAILPSANVYALASDGGDLLIGTQQGARKWNGQTASSFGQGSSWSTRPSQFFDLMVEGNAIYAGTNIGLCKYTLSTLAIQDCVNAQDGMPNWAVYSVGTNATVVFGGTVSGVGLLDKSSFTWSENWENDFGQSGNAVVEIIGDVAFIGINGFGVLRYNLTTQQWLTPYTLDNVLDNGNEDVSGLAADIRPYHLWVGGADGFQLINVTSGQEVYDIERSSSLYTGTSEPYQMIVHNNVMYYRSDNSDSIGRIDLVNFNQLALLDAGPRVNENGGVIYGLGLVGDILIASVASSQWWNAEGSGGLALWNTSNNSWGTSVFPEGQVDRVTAYESSLGNTWVAWGESKLELYDSNYVLQGSWDQFDFPIRGIVEWKGATLFATEDGIVRYDEQNSQWLSTWTEGNGLPNNAGTHFFELWTDGNHLIIGGGIYGNFGGGDFFQEGVVTHINGITNITTLHRSSQSNNIPNGYPISATMCGGYLHMAMYQGTGSIARFNILNNQSTTVSPFQRSDFGGFGVASVACDSSETLYVGFYNNNQGISKYSYSTQQWLNQITTAANGLPSDLVWYDGLDWSNGRLIVGHGVGNDIAGGYSIFTSNGATTGQATVRGGGSSATSFQWLGASWLMGQAGGSSGYSRVSNISILGEQVLLDLPGIVSGQLGTISGNATSVYVTTKPTTGGTGNSFAATGVLKGHFLANGSLEWDFGWTFPGRAIAYDAEMVNTDMYFSTIGNGLFKLSANGQLQKINGGLHQNLDGIVRYGGDLVIGLAAESGSSPGVQNFNLTTQTFTSGRLIAGLPSNIVNGFGTSSTHMYIATDNGIGVWNYSNDDWEDSITSADGLPSSVVNDIFVGGSSSSGSGSLIYFATANGVVEYDEGTSQLQTIGKAQGLAGNSAWMFAESTSPSGATNLLISHDGRGDERPGISILSLSTNPPTLDSTHKFDQLPSNIALSLSSDWWGVHISTLNSQQMIHWNSSSGDFEEGQGFVNLNSWWPARDIMSNGNQIVSISSNNGIAMLESRTNAHSILNIALPPEGINEVRQGVVTSSHFWLTTDQGLIGFENNGQYNVVDDFILRRAQPLQFATAGGAISRNVTSQTHVGDEITLVDPTNPLSLNLAGDVAGPHNTTFSTMPFMFTSPVDNAMVWTKLVDLKYNAIINLSNDENLVSNLQYAIDSGMLLNNTQHVSLTLQSPQNGTLLVRLSYDYIRRDTPIQLNSIYDRPDDGGSTLMVEWSLIHDPDFSQYHVFVNDGPWINAPTELELRQRTPDKTISLHSRTSTDVSTANGVALVDGREYYAIVVTQYNDGRWGNIPLQIGPATPTDEVPRPPKWAIAEPHTNGQDGEIELEWARCTALDLASTNVYVSKNQFSDVVGIKLHDTINVLEGNTSIISLTPQTPYWIGFTCVDEAGQENKSDVTIVGPVVPTGELNDNQAPLPIDGTTADDFPNDEGGRISVHWNVSIDDDCSLYIVFMKQAQSDGVTNADDTNITTRGSISDFSQATIISPCDVNQTIISSLDGVPLIDGQEYIIGVVAYDAWLNGNTEDVLLVTATPLQNIVGSGTIPDRVTNIMAFDHPEDDGKAIDVVWQPSEADDFASYTIWVADKPLTDISWLYASRGTNAANCGCFSFNKQWIDERTNPIELTISTALYGGQDLLATTPQLIQPDVKLYVVVTVHDIKGNVHVDDLIQATVTPIDNLNDNDPPERIDTISILDVPNDDGTSVFVDFELSNASDISSYEIYGATWAFSSVNIGGDGPTDPLFILSRTPELPIRLDLLAGETQIIAGLDIWVAVVTVDAAGNAHRTELIVAEGSAVDNGGFSLNDPLSPALDVKVSWIDERDILIQWENPTDERVDGMRLYIKNEGFSTIDEADFLGEVKGETSFIITNDVYSALVNSSKWYIAVTPFNALGVEKDVVPVVLNNVDASETGGEENGDGTEFSINAILSQEMLLALGLGIVLLFTLITLVRGRKRAGGARISKDWELQESTWGIETSTNWSGDTFETPVQQPPSQTEQQIGTYGRQVYQASQPVLQPVQQPQQFIQPTQTPTQDAPSSIDTSFLDDLL